MGVSELEQIALKLANQCFTRYWLHYNYPTEPAQMAIAVMGSSNANQLHKELIERGFTYINSANFPLWVIDRND